jgi:hypothetical protein
VRVVNVVAFNTTVGMERPDADGYATPGLGLVQVSIRDAISRHKPM